MYPGNKTRIPGPAGDIVTDLISTSQTEGKSHLESELSGDDDGHLRPHSNSFDDVFSQSVAWKSMVSEFESDPPPAKLLSTLCKSGSLKKIPRLAVSIVCLECIYDAYATFRDDSGLMQGTIHRKVFEEHQGLVEIGAVLVLKNVSVFSPTASAHFLNVCPSNIERIFPYTVRQDLGKVDLDSAECLPEKNENPTLRPRPSSSQDREHVNRSIRQKLDHNGEVRFGDQSQPNQLSQARPLPYSPEHLSPKFSNESSAFSQLDSSNDSSPHTVFAKRNSLPQALKPTKFLDVRDILPESGPKSDAMRYSANCAGIGVLASPSCKSSVRTNASILDDRNHPVELSQKSSQLHPKLPLLTNLTSVVFSQTLELPDINMDLLEENALEL